MKILITGANGLLGQKLVELLLREKIAFVATSKGENRNPDCPNSHYRSLDITLEKEIEEVFMDERPTHVIHTAALTNVDYCELHPVECDQVNVMATRFLIKWTNSVRAHFQFISTDFVFDGDTGNYKEEDATKPLSVYGQSKLDGERLVQREAKYGWSIVRTIIVYGKGNNLSRSNLIVWAKETLEQGGAMKIIDDQFRAPTFAKDLAMGCLLIFRANKSGIFHISGPETLSIYQIVERIASHFHYPMTNVERISSTTLNQPATRPPKTGFDLEKSYTQLGYRPRSLEESLDLMYNNHLSS